MPAETPPSGGGETATTAPDAGPGGAVLVVGYGNRLRTDDGLGWRAVERLADDPRVAGAELLCRHQLTPELAVDIAAASLVVLIDAAAYVAPGVVEVRKVATSPSGGALMSHHFDPQSLLTLAGRLYGSAPPVYLVSVGAYSLDDGERLSTVVETAMPKVLDTVAEIVARGREAAREDGPKS
jgi:hydrogenase maturation protease